MGVLHWSPLCEYGRWICSLVRFKIPSVCVDIHCVSPHLSNLHIQLVVFISQDRFFERIAETFSCILPCLLDSSCSVMCLCHRNPWILIVSRNNCEIICPFLSLFYSVLISLWSGFFQGIVFLMPLMGVKPSTRHKIEGWSYIVIGTMWVGFSIFLIYLMIKVYRLYRRYNM